MEQRALEHRQPVVAITDCRVGRALQKWMLPLCQPDHIVGIAVRARIVTVVVTKLPLLLCKANTSSSQIPQAPFKEQYHGLGMHTTVFL